VRAGVQVSVGQEWREEDQLPRVPIVVTANDLSTLYAPLLRDGRMEKYYWEPTYTDLHRMIHTCVRPSPTSPLSIGSVLVPMGGLKNERTMTKVVPDPLCAHGSGSPQTSRFCAKCPALGQVVKTSLLHLLR